MQCDECGNVLYTAGEVVPAGTYVRVDDRSLRRVTFTRRGPLPASFDGRIAQYQSICIHHAQDVGDAPAESRK